MTLHQENSRARFAGVDIGGTKIRVVLCDRQGSVLSWAETATPRGGGAMISAASELLRRLCTTEKEALSGIGVGAAGVIDHGGGTVRVASDSFVDWAGYPVVAELGQTFGVPVALENDVNSFLRGEMVSGVELVNAKDSGDAVGIMLGTGVGGALWIGGGIFTGSRGGAGEIGHIPGFGDLLCTCGGHGHLETLASGRSIATRFAQAAARTGERLTGKDVALAASSGDERALAVFLEAGRAVGRAIAIVAGLDDIDTVIVGGGVSEAWALLEPGIREELAYDPPVGGRELNLFRSVLGADAVAVGAAVLATELTKSASS